MDTPSSTVTSTASNASQLTNSRKIGNQLQDRSALIDISNDSPVVGLESGSLTTPSAISRMRNGNLYLEMKTPGSGESILRSQVKTLLQKVEEEAEITKNTLFSPCLLNQQCFKYVCHDSVVQENDKISQLVSEISYGKKQGSSLISELSAEKSEEGKNDDSILTEDDNSSVWSTQVNAGSIDEKEEEEEEEEEVDELCEVMKKMDVVGSSRHTRFLYDSEDELVKVEEVQDEKEAGVLKLKGLPTPQGKHMRFPLEEEEENE